MDQSNCREVQNLYEGAYLLARGFKLAGKRQAGQKVTVLFEGPAISEEALKYYNRGKVGRYAKFS